VASLSLAGSSALVSEARNSKMQIGKEAMTMTKTMILMKMWRMLL
jgi:hypothetical protein